MNHALAGFTLPTEPTEQQITNALDEIDLLVLAGQGDPIHIASRLASTHSGRGDFRTARIYSAALARYQHTQETR